VQGVRIGKTEAEFEIRRGREESLDAGIRLVCVTSVAMIKLTSSGETLRKTAEHR